MPLRDVARLMREFDCGEIPVVDGADGGARRPIGVITDRDIACRAVAEGKSPAQLTAKDCMSSPVVTVTADTSVEACAQVMETHQIRRVPVIDEGGSCCGIVSQADLALRVPESEAGRVVKEISRHDGPSAQPANAMATDPVCGMHVPMNTAAGTSMFDGATFYFCSADCLQKFNQRPEAYAAPA
jgi:YHS domain-containing protein/predicted transcriptional regulator